LRHGDRAAEGDVDKTRNGFGREHNFERGTVPEQVGDIDFEVVLRMSTLRWASARTFSSS